MKRAQDDVAALTPATTSSEAEMQQGTQRIKAYDYRSWDKLNVVRWVLPIYIYMFV